MNYFFFFLITLSWSVLSAGAQTLPKAIEAQLPNMVILKTVEADLNKDQRPDYVLIGESLAGEDTKLSLHIFFSKVDKSFQTVLNSQTILCSDCSSMKSGPNPYIVEIKNGVLLLKFFGGSRVTEERTTKWRFEDGSFLITGATVERIDSAGFEKGKVYKIKLDINYLAGMMEEKITRLDGTERNPKEISTTSKCKAPKDRVKLQDYIDLKYVAPTCTGITLAE